jgi:hypothetical protein
MTLKAFVRTIRKKLLRWKMPSVELASGRVGKLSVSIIAYIAENGDLHVDRDDTGPGASMTGAEEEESIAAIDKEDKDRLLLALLKEHYGGNTNAQHEIAKFAASKGIKVTRFHWP